MHHYQHKHSAFFGTPSVYMQCKIVTGVCIGMAYKLHAKWLGICDYTANSEIFSLLLRTIVSHRVVCKFIFDNCEGLVIHKQMICAMDMSCPGACSMFDAVAGKFA